MHFRCIMGLLHVVAVVVQWFAAVPDPVLPLMAEVRVPSVLRVQVVRPSISAPGVHGGGGVQWWCDGLPWRHPAVGLSASLIVLQGW